MENIKSILKEIEQKKNITILFACETGSRAWGFPSPDSDYDVRFIYRHNIGWYLSLSQKKDTLEFMAGDLDVTGWDLRKSLMLLKKSNAPLIERFQSPMEYYSDNSFKIEFKHLIESYYSPTAVFFHHYSLAKKFWEEVKDKETFKLKNYFYLMRSLLSCNWIVKDKTVLPMHIEGLMKYINEDQRKLLRELIQLKSTVGEKYLHPKDETLNNWIVELFEFLEPNKENLGVSKTDFSNLNDFFLKRYMKELTIDWIKDNGLLVLEAITGSKAFGLDTATSDTDIRGVFVLPKKMFYSLDYIGQVSNETSDIVYYELKRFMELLSKNNPNIIEMLGIPKNCLLHKDNIMERLKPEMFLSKLCEKAFANYAFTQVKKAYSLEKKIVNPLDKERKTVLDFCFVYHNSEAVPVKKFLEKEGLEQDKIGLASISHLRDSYNMFYSDSLPYSGIIRKEDSNDVCLSNIPKNEQPVGLLYFNRDAYSVYCKKYKEYWEWVGKRNDVRYQSTMSHGKNYDAKNMMHVFRLLLMAKEIAVEREVKVLRNDREFLLSIKEGCYEYDELLEKAQKLKDELPLLYQNAQLQEEPDVEKINELLIEMREDYYKLNN